MTLHPTRVRSVRRFAFSALCAIVTLGPAGCRGWNEVDYAATFPERMPIAETLPIQVVREDTRITITNTTARAIPETRMWINKWFSRPVDALGVGETVTFELRDFRDEHSEPFRAGGFWATREGDPVVSAHIERDGRLYGLVVVTKRGG